MRTRDDDDLIRQRAAWQMSLRQSALQAHEYQRRREQLRRWLYVLDVVFLLLCAALVVWLTMFTLRGG